MKAKRVAAAPTDRKRAAERRGAAMNQKSQTGLSPEGVVESINRPVEWKLTTLGTLSGERGKSVEPARTPEKQFELYSVPSFPGQRPEVVSGKEVGSNKQLVQPQSVLLCKINPRINRAWVVGDFTAHSKIASTEWIVFPTFEEVVPEFLCYFLQQNAVRDFLAHNASGVGGSLMRVKPSTLRDFPFAYPKTSEQRRIVAEIEKQFTRLDAGVAALRRVQANLKRYRAAVLNAACEGRLVPAEAELARKGKRKFETGEELLARVLAERREHWTGSGNYREPAALDRTNLGPLPEGWTWATFEQIAGRVTVGFVGSMKHEYVESGVPFLRGQNVRENRFDSEGLLYVSRAFHEELAKSALRPGDLAVVRSGSVGVTCVIPDSLPEANCSDLVLVQRPVGFVPQYGAYYMNSLAKRHIAAGKVGVALIHFNTKSVAALAVPLPPLAEQTRIVAEVERRLSVLEELEAMVIANLQRATRLRQSILQKAFTGELV